MQMITVWLLSGVFRVILLLVPLCDVYLTMFKSKITLLQVTFYLLGAIAEVWRSFVKQFLIQQLQKLLKSVMNGFDCVLPAWPLLTQIFLLHSPWRKSQFKMFPHSHLWYQAVQMDLSSVARFWDIRLWSLWMDVLFGVLWKMTEMGLSWLF